VKWWLIWFTADFHCSCEWSGIYTQAVKISKIFSEPSEKWGFITHKNNMGWGEIKNKIHLSKWYCAIQRKIIFGSIHLGNKKLWYKDLQTMPHDWLDLLIMSSINNGLSNAKWELSSFAVEQQCCLLNSMHSS
jgi:hypothetical protein